MDVVNQLKKAKRATKELASIDHERKSQIIHDIADSITADSEEILEINKKEVENAQQNNTSSTALDRLKLDDNRLKNAIESAHKIADLHDPVGEVIEEFEGVQGIQIKKVRVPLGVVAVIYENRPNVTIDAAVISLKSSNVSVLRGSSSALQTNKRIMQSIHRAIAKNNLDESIVTFISDPTRQGAEELMRAKGLIDVLIPRGGQSLIEAIENNAKIPYIIDGSGNCHVYVDKDADLELAEKIVINSKTQRPSVCNSAESLVVHRDIAKEFLENISIKLNQKNVELTGDSCSVDFGMGHVSQATHQDFESEFLDLKMSIAVVESIDGAINHINKYSSGHSEAIVTDNPESVEYFNKFVDSAVVLHNTSTRFTDGERFGFGAEIGISTQKLHARGPMALRELTTYQYQVSSDGQIV